MIARFDGFGSQQVTWLDQGAGTEHRTAQELLMVEKKRSTDAKTHQS